MSVQDTTVGGKYVVGPKIGSGSFGEVYIASELGVHEIYALKKVSF
jgi:serine/threonine protein kinase